MKQGSTRIAIVLDRSGSMRGMEESVISGLNKFFDAQKKEPGAATVRFCQFDSQGYDVMFDLPLQQVPELLSKDFNPRASTPLYDAQARTINDLGAELAALAEQDRPERVIVVTMTDGEENCSQEYDLRKVKALIEDQTNKYGWTFVYLGANQDAVKVGLKMGMKRGSTMTYATNAVAMANTTDSLNNYVRGVRARGVAAFTDEDRLKSMQK